jgi:hypothetical protein
VRLKEALVNEKKYRKRCKALPLEAAEECHGGAVFWSPRKEKEARDRQQQQGLEEEQQRLQKAEIARDCEEQRQVKSQARAEARIVRQAEKAREAADRASRAAARRAQQAHHHLNHDTAEQSSSHQNKDSCIYQSRPVELNTK